MVEAAGLELQIEAERDRIALTDQVILSVRLTNRSLEALTICERFLVNDSSAPERARDLSFEIVGPPGYISSYVFHVNAGAPKPEQFLELKPEESVTKRVDLTEYYSLHHPGTYRLRGTYLNATRVDAFGRAAWVGRVGSNWAEFNRVASA
jgi:hypothetical protein